MLLAVCGLKKLSDLGLQPQAPSHGTGMASVITDPGHCLLCSGRCSIQRHNMMNGFVAKLNCAHSGCSLCEHWDVVALHLPDGCYLRLREYSCSASYVNH